MSLRSSNRLRTICEVLREINDISQGSSLHEQILPRLQEAERMAKKMSRKLYDNNKQWDAKFWEQNPDYEKDFLKRMDETYIV
jgi:hypothetical protein